VHGWVCGVRWLGRRAMARAERGMGGAAVSEHREARWQAQPAGGGKQQRAGQTVGDGEVGDDGQRLRSRGCGDLQWHAEHHGEVGGVDGQLECPRGKLVR